MAFPLVTVGQKMTAAIYNTWVTAINADALTRIIPASVSGTGVSIATNGKVSFIGAPSVSLNGIFSSTFDNYRIVFNVLSRSAAVTINFRLRSAGTDMSSSVYNWIRGIDSGTSRTVANTSGGTAAPLDSGSPAASSSTDGSLELYGPALGTYTAALANSVASSALAATNVGIEVASATSFDGFTLYPVSGTITGALRVYGYNNAL